MHGNISIPQGIKEELILKKQMLIDLADTKVPHKKRKHIGLGLLLRSGALLPPAISVILGFNGSNYKQNLLHILENMVPKVVSDAEMTLHTTVCQGFITSVCETCKGLWNKVGIGLGQASQQR